MNPVTAQMAQDAMPAKPRRVSMTNLPVLSGSWRPDLPDRLSGRSAQIARLSSG
jgi:hypothetical protein